MCTLLFAVLLEEYEVLVNRIDVMRGPAKSAAERHKWLHSIEFLGASRLFDINVIVLNFSSKQRSQYTWSRYTPTVDRNLHNWEQNKDKYSIFIYYDDDEGHFQVIDNVN